jgi:MoxR-like ATPase
MQTTVAELNESMVKELLAKLHRLPEEVGKVIVGQRETIEEMIIALLAGGHGLLEGVPGLAKTLMVRTMAQAIDLSFQRIQFTPDLMPTDILGTEVLEEDHTTGKRFFKFNKGPIFANIVLADEINRTPAKTQAALLEAMQEFAVTYGGQTYPLDKPFFILATQNPIEQAGTYPLPEAQLDRFLLFIRVAYPSEQEEFEVLANTTGSRQTKINPVLTGGEVVLLQQLVREVTINEDLIRFVTQLVRSTRPAETAVAYVKEWVRWGAGPRAGQALILTAKARALLKDRFAVTMEDLAVMALPVLRHRVLINFRAEAEGITSDQVTKELLKVVERPKGVMY